MRRIVVTMSFAAALGLLSAIALSGVSNAAETTEHQTSAAAPSVYKPDSAAVSSMMQQMQAKHEKMMRARTATDRQAVMADHMKFMQEGMDMMQKLGSSSEKSGMSPQMMQLRMNMMTDMRQMMMAHQGAGAMPMGMSVMDSAPTMAGK